MSFGYMNKILIGFILFAIAHTLIWFQLNGQFIWNWFRKNTFLLALVLGTSISYILIIATRNIVEGFDGLLWPGRFIGFSIGIVIFGFLTYLFFHEEITLKTAISILLAIGLICIQLFWK